MIVYRLAKKKRVHDLSGNGAFKVGGRWTPAGVPALYTALHSSLAAWEVFVHRVEKNEWPSDYYLASLKIPDDHKDYKVLRGPQLPAGWDALPYSREIQQIGYHWFVEQSKLALFAPSAVMKDEQNVILNPMHEHFKAKVKVVEAGPFAFDTRLKKGFV